MNFTENELDKLRVAFLFHDKDGTGNVPNEKVGTIFRSLNPNITDEEVHHLISEVDKESIGSVNFDQFLEMIVHLPEVECTENRVLEASRIIDRDDEGNISVTELRHVLTTMGNRLTEEACDEVLRDADKAGDGKINFEDFVKMLMKE